MKPVTLAILAGIALGPMAPFGAAVAQTNPGQQDLAAALPPALRAAVATGQTQAIQQAIATLSGGDAGRSYALAVAVVRAAEQLLATNPQAAVQAAAAAVNTIRTDTTQPQPKETVLTTAARIFINPAAERAAPDATAQLALATVSVAATTNPTLAATIAGQAVSSAERLLATSPAAAVQIAGAALQVAKDAATQQAVPGQCLQVATTAARIMLQPEVQRIAPQATAAMAVSAAQIASSPVVYQSSPTAALAVMDSAYNTAVSPAITAAAPDTVTILRTTLQSASITTALNQSNPTNAATINEILAGKSPTFAKTQEQDPVNNTNARGENPIALGSPS